LLSRGASDDLFYLAAVEVEFACYGSLAGARMVPSPYCLLQRWRFGWYVLLFRWFSVAIIRVCCLFHGCPMRGSDECHQELLLCGCKADKLVTLCVSPGQLLVGSC